MIAVIVAIGFFLTCWFFFRNRAPNTSQAFFIDEETGEESIRSAFQYPPLLGKSGKPTVVEEFKYTCDGGATVKVAYYMKYTDTMKKHLDDSYAQTQKPNDFDASIGLLIRSPVQGSPWVSWHSEASSPIKDAMTCPEGHNIETVLP